MGVEIHLDKEVKLSDLKKALAKEIAWKSLPKGWDEKSARKFWDTLVGDVAHKRTKCIEKLEGTDIDDPGAFCQTLYMMFEKG